MPSQGKIKQQHLQGFFKKKILPDTSLQIQIGDKCRKNKNNKIVIVKMKNYGRRFHK